MQLRNKIKSSLESKGLTMGDLAAHMQISQGSLSSYLKRDIRVSTALILTDSLNALTQTQLTLDDFRKDQ